MAPDPLDWWERGHCQCCLVEPRDYEEIGYILWKARQKVVVAG